MKKILHISKYYDPFVGGVESIAKDCVIALSNNYKQEVICFDHVRGRSDSIDKVDGIKVIRCAQDFVVASQAISRSYEKNLKDEIQNFSPDVIIFHYPNPFVAHFLLKFISKKIKLIIWWHLDIYKQKILKNFFNHQNRKLLERADKIVATSPNYIDGSPWLKIYKYKCVVIPCCINESRLTLDETEKENAQRIKKQNKNKVICLAVGRHVPYKGFNYLIKASKLLDNRFKIYITGNGPLTKKLKKMAKDDPKIEFLGLIDDSQLKSYLEACDIFVFPSITKNEAFGIALAEGMYFGKPAVTFHIPGSGVNFVSLNGITGIECRNSDHREFANALNQLADDENLTKKLGINAKKRVTNNFLFKEFKVNISNLMEDIA